MWGAHETGEANIGKVRRQCLRRIGSQPKAPPFMSGYHSTIHEALRSVCPCKLLISSPSFLGVFHMVDKVRQLFALQKALRLPYTSANGSATHASGCISEVWTVLERYPCVQAYSRNVDITRRCVVR
jgi:hypothetical protein